MLDCILREIVGFLPTYKLLDWIDEGLLKKNYRDLSRNPSPGAIKLLMNNKHKIDRIFLIMNKNPDAVKLVLKRLADNKNKKDWKYLAMNRNPDIVKLVLNALMNNKNKIDWYSLSLNPNPDVVKFVLDNKDKINWDALSRNPNPDAVKLLMENVDKIDWYCLADNQNPDAVKFFIKETMGRMDEELELILKWKGMDGLDYDCIAWMDPQSIHEVVIKNDRWMDMYGFTLLGNPAIFTPTYNTELLSKFE
jgi:hypothetical protein